MLIIDAFFDEMLTEENLSLLRKKRCGGTRLIISYLCIGEAEDYRYYWKDEYSVSPPSWILDENPN